MYSLEVELLLWNCGGTARRQRTEMSTIRSPHSDQCWYQATTTETSGGEWSHCWTL